MIGFLEESEGVRSITRLTIAWMCVLATAIVAATCWYVVKGKGASDVVLALGGILLTLAAKTVVAIINRNGPDDTK